MRTRRPRATPLPRSAFAGFRFPPDVIVLAVRWYLRFGLSYRDVEEWRFVYRAIDQLGQVIDVFVSSRRDAKTVRQFFEQAITTTRVLPHEVVTDRAPTYPVVLEDLLPAAWNRTDRYANNAVECDHGRLKARLRPMRGQQDRNARVMVIGHAFVQNVRRGPYELAVEEPTNRRMPVAFDKLASVI